MYHVIVNGHHMRAVTTCAEASETVAFILSNCHEYTAKVEILFTPESLTDEQYYQTALKAGLIVEAEIH